jgi:hypothetical protein
MPQSRIFLSSIFLSCAILLPAVPASAQFKEGEPGGPQMGEARVSKWQVGFEIRAVGGPCKGIVGYMPVPVEWPEQEVRIVARDITGGATIGYQPIEDIKMMVVRVPHIQANETVKALVTFEVRRSVQLLPAEKERKAFVLPDVKKLDASIRRSLRASPQIEVSDPAIREAAREVGADKELAWERVEALYDWARKKVEYKQGGKCKGAKAALRDGVGSHEDITSLFIALCRAANIPARTVWVPEFCYAEFYLLDGDGRGHWIPCQPAGARTFGQMPDTKPILAKGDCFHPPYPSKEKQMRYLAEGGSGANLVNGGKPQIVGIHQLVP